MLQNYCDTTGSAQGLHINAGAELWINHRLWSLVEMIEHLCAIICSMLDNIHTTYMTIADHGTSAGSGSQVSEEDRKEVLSLIDIAGTECYRLELTAAVRRVIQLQARLQISGDVLPRSYSIIQAELLGLHHTILSELADKKFAFIGPRFAPYFEQPKLFGEKVYDNFESARQEIKDAGNCLAADLGTAAVFHLMRIAEHGMRALAAERHVRMKATELDFADWHQIISALDKQADAIANWKGRSARKAAALEFYRGAVRQLDGFKEEWRNHVMHTRKSYDFNQAESVFDRVREFMQRLTSVGLLENQRKSINWRRKQ
jgi:hypothetical protein